MKVYRTSKSVDAPYHIQVATYYDWNAAPLPRYLASMEDIHSFFCCEHH